MPSGLRLTASLSLVASVLGLALGCGEKQDHGRPLGAANRAGSSGTGATGATGATGTGGSSSGGSGTIIVSGGSAGMSNSGGSGVTPECGGDQYEAMLLPLDIYVMLDSSDSMLEEAGSSTKWEGIQGALSAFIDDPASSGIGIGLQFFPQHDPNVPLTCKLIAECGSDDNVCVRNFCQNAGPMFFVCDTNADCRDGSDDYGPCTRLTYCWSSGGAVPCHNDALDCDGRAGDCVEIGRCSGNPSFICNQIGAPCSASTGESFGTCRRDEDTQCARTSNCSAAAYGAPAAEIATLPGSANALSDVIMARVPDGKTPTAPALQGALDHARAWATAHAGHTVAVLLATDGLPTECVADEVGDPSGVNGVVSEAKAGVSGSPSISTFVIGVFSEADDQQLMAGMNLDRIAAAGGTVSAHIVHTGGNVEQEFLDALDAIRGTRLPCDFQIPTPTSGTFNKSQVNVVYSHDGQEETLFYWSGASDCDATLGGWYFDDPDDPTKIIACPASCSQFQAASAGSAAQGAQVRIQLGCATVVR